MKFQINDIVEFQLSPARHRNEPRWQNNIDHGGFEKWATGKILSLDAYTIVVSYTIEGYFGDGKCFWPNALNIAYNPNQWNFPGYLRKKVILKCECGGAIAKTTHSHWCPVYEGSNTTRGK